MTLDTINSSKHKSTLDWFNLFYELLHTALNSLRSSGIMWKGKHYELTLELYNAAIDSDFSLGMCNNLIASLQISFII